MSVTRARSWMYAKIAIYLRQDLVMLRAGRVLYRARSSRGVNLPKSPLTDATGLCLAP